MDILSFYTYYPQCGHQGGKVVVPTNTHVSRLVASRFQLDVLQSPVLVIARTDSESAPLISSNIDVADHEHILGTINPGKALADLLSEAEQRGASGTEIDSLEGKWMSKNELMTFNEGSHYIVPFNIYQRIVLSCASGTRGGW